MPDENNLPADPAELQKMIADLRSENAGWRTKLRSFEDAFKTFTPEEQSFLLDNVKLLGADERAGAEAFRGIAQHLLGDRFLEGIEIPQAEDEGDDEGDETMPKKETAATAGLTREELIAILDERDGKVTAAQQAAQADAEVEAIFKEIESLGFERGSTGFGLMLQRAAALTQKGDEADFTKLAEPARKAAAALDGVEYETPKVEKVAEEDTTKFPTTSEAVTSPGAPTDGDGDGWVAKAKAEGKDVWAVARERADARIAAAADTLP